MPREWNPLGAGDFKPVPLSKNTKECIQIELNRFGADISNIQSFFSEIEYSIARFKAINKIKDDSKPSAVRKNLNSAYESALVLNKSLSHLDSNSWLLLSQNINGGVGALNEHLMAIIDALAQALHAADDLPKKGRLHDHARKELLRDMCILFKKQGIEPLTTKEGLFSNVLSKVLEEATGKPVSAIHDLVSKAKGLNIDLD
jgi:hypothetical protein